MVCAVFAWGNFNFKEKVFLLLLGGAPHHQTSNHILVACDPLIIKQPLPMPANSTPLQNIKDRGSIMMFNQASIFQLVS
ncbi:hypothetical protein OH76DRAFT_1490514 [Lentinus brumalis]|uniref:Uncharacterized protein n=1 Tax=Lentinus brumalis TaxID=2498619 RepID=A0A371CIS0_9APHY|nr:hypothetical protein OH76DRAFT_1490514 [Polyporus brumalis]